MTLDELAGLSKARLEQLYREASGIEIPDGDSVGRAIVLPGTTLGKVISAIDNRVWKGKIFDRAAGRLVNKILGLRFVPAEVFIGLSWSDEKKSVIIDYRRTSWLAFFIRDEVRSLEDGLYLGKAYLRTPFGPLFFLYFALDFRASK